MRLAPCELPRSWPIRNRSSSSVLPRRRARAQAAAVPMAPPPTTTASHRSRTTDRVVGIAPMLGGRGSAREGATVAKIGFLGTGSMGRPMAGRLVGAGHDVTVWNRTRERTEPLARAGAAVAGSPAEAAQGAGFVVTMLTDGAAVEEVLFREDGAVAGM